MLAAVSSSTKLQYTYFELRKNATKCKIIKKRGIGGGAQEFPMKKKKPIFVQKVHKKEHFGTTLCQNQDFFGMKTLLHFHFF